MFRKLFTSFIAAAFLAMAPVGFSTSFLQSDQAQAGPIWASRGNPIPLRRKASDGIGAYRSGKPVSSVENAYGHYQKHRSEFPNIQNSKQYVDAARNMIKNPPAGTLTKTRKNGDTLFYNLKSNTFVASRSDGAPKTMFKPGAGRAYWDKQ